jgi:NADH:ubiquinone oxidoreductase 27 kD subunit
MLADLSVIEIDRLFDETKRLKDSGYRFAAMTCEHEGEEYEITYHFDMDLIMKHLRVMIKPGSPVPSISPIFPASFLMENEIQDLYGFEFEGLIIDYRGKMFLAPDGPKTPMLEKDKE